MVDIGALKPEANVDFLTAKGVCQTRAQRCGFTARGIEAMSSVIECSGSVDARVAENVHRMLHHGARFLNHFRNGLHLVSDSVSGDDASYWKVAIGPGRVVRSVEEHCSVVALASELQQTRNHVSFRRRLRAPEVRANLVRTARMICWGSTARCRRLSRGGYLSYCICLSV